MHACHHALVDELAVALPEVLHIVLLPDGEGQPVQEDGEPEVAVDPALLVAELDLPVRPAQVQGLCQGLDVPVDGGEKRILSDELVR